jgi:hypothetical protein
VFMIVVFMIVVIGLLMTNLSGLLITAIAISTKGAFGT